MTNDRQPPPEGHWPRRLWRTGPALALAIGLAMALVACGGSSSDEGSSAGVIQADDLAQPAEETAPAPSSGAEGPQAAPDTGAATEPDVSATDAATPNADPPSEEAPEPATQEDVFLMFAQCLRDEGLDVDDPDFSAGRGPGGLPSWHRPRRSGGASRSRYVPPADRERPPRAQLRRAGGAAGLACRLHHLPSRPGARRRGSRLLGRGPGRRPRSGRIPPRYRS